MSSGSFGNYYLVNPREGWATLCISKNACTSLKAAVLTSLGRAVPDTTNDIHDLIGYRTSELLRPVADGPPPGLTTFAVWRDPVDRWYSAIAYLRRRDELLPRRTILGRRNSVRIRLSLAQALAVTRAQLRIDPLVCDEHLRRQSDYGDFDAVDHVVRIEDLAGFFADRGWGPLPRRNEGDTRITRDPAVSAEIRDLYAADLLVGRCV